MSVLAFAGSNSSASINYQLVTYTVSMIENHNIRRFDMSGKPFPMYSMDRERDDGIPGEVTGFLDEIRNATALIIAVNEHNRNFSAYFKNLIDWLSRADRNFLAGKQVFLMSTSTGQGAGRNSLSLALKTLPRFGATITATFSLPSFGQHFSPAEGGITDAELRAAHRKALDTFLEELS